MEKGYEQQQSAPPYPGPPVNYGPGPLPEMYPPPPTVVHHVATPYVVATSAPPVTVTHRVVTSVLEDVPGQTVCPHCQQTVITQTQHKSGLMTWLICGGVAVIGGCLCCWIPFCIDACKDVEHRCSNCQRVIHIYKRMS